MIISKKKKYALIVDRVLHLLEKRPVQIENGFTTGKRIYRGADIRLISLTEHNMRVLGLVYE